VDRFGYHRQDGCERLTRERAPRPDVTGPTHPAEDLAAEQHAAHLASGALLGYERTFATRRCMARGTCFHAYDSWRRWLDGSRCGGLSAGAAPDEGLSDMQKCDSYICWRLRLTTERGNCAPLDRTASAHACAPTALCCEQRHLRCSWTRVEDMIRS
jgi:hypothetical protein